MMDYSPRPGRLRKVRRPQPFPPPTPHAALRPAAARPRAADVLRDRCRSRGPVGGSRRARTAGAGGRAGVSGRPLRGLPHRASSPRAGSTSPSLPDDPTLLGRRAVGSRSRPRPRRRDAAARRRVRPARGRRPVPRGGLRLADGTAGRRGGGAGPVAGAAADGGAAGTHAARAAGGGRAADAPRPAGPPPARVHDRQRRPRRSPGTTWRTIWKSWTRHWTTRSAGPPCRTTNAASGSRRSSWAARTASAAAGTRCSRAGRRWSGSARCRTSAGCRRPSRRTAAAGSG